MNLKPIVMMSLGAISSTTLADECSTALSLYNGCEISSLTSDVSYNVKLVTNTDFSPNNETDALERLDRLVLLVDGAGNSQSTASAINAIVNEELPGTDDHYNVVTVQSPTTITTDENGILGYKIDVTKVGTVQEGSAVLQTLIGNINTLRGESARPTTMMGYSLGGVTLRHALTTMENNGVSHNAGLYVSYDAPHQGVHIPQAAQNIIPLAKEYADIAKGLNETIGLTIDGFGADMSSKLEETMGLSLNSPLGKQMVIDNIYGSSERDSLLDELSTLGYPSNSRNVFITNGSASGISQPDWVLEPETGAFYHFVGKQGDQIDVVNHPFLQADFSLYPTVAGKISASAKLSIEIPFSGPCPIFIFLTCNGTNSTGVPQSKNAASDIMELDTVPGSTLDIMDALLLTVTKESFFPFSDVVSTNFLYGAYPLKNRVDPSESSWVNAYLDNRTSFTFIPTFSALDIVTDDPALPLTLKDDDVAKTYVMGDANNETSLSNLSHNVVSIPDGLFADMAEAMVPPYIPPTAEERTVLWLNDIDTTLINISNALSNELVTNRVAHSSIFAQPIDRYLNQTDVDMVERTLQSIDDLNLITPEPWFAFVFPNWENDLSLVVNGMIQYVDTHYGSEYYKYRKLDCEILGNPQSICDKLLTESDKP